MKGASRWIGVAAVGVGLFIAAGAMAEDWPQWRGPNRDGKAAGFTAPAEWPKELTPAWKVRVGLGDSSPVLVGDKIYVIGREGTSEATWCLTAADGKEVWKESYDAPAITGPDAAEHPGPRSTPAVADGKIVTEGIWGVIICRDAAKGTILWQKDLYPKTGHPAASPLIVDGLVIAQVGKEDSGAIVALDLAKGDVKWKWDAEGPGHASPVLMTVEGTKMVVALTAKSVVGVGLADGKLLWKLPFPSQGSIFNAATPIVDGSTVIYTGQGRGTTAVKVEKKGDAFATTELWTDKTGTQFNTPVLKDGALYGLSDGGQLFCIDAKVGKTKWTQPLSAAPAGGGRRGGGNFGAIVDAGSVLLVLPSSGEMIVMKPNDAKYEEVARVKVGAAGTYGFPIVMGKQIFVKDKDTLNAWTIK